MPDTPSDDGGLRPAIVAIALIAVTAIVALAGATFVLGTTADASGDGAGPEATFEITWEGAPDAPGPVTITHTGGDAVAADRLELRGYVTGERIAASPFGSSGTVEYPDSATVAGVTATDAVRLVWVGPDGSTVTLATWIGPQA